MTQTQFEWLSHSLKPAQHAKDQSQVDHAKQIQKADTVHNTLGLKVWGVVDHRHWAEEANLCSTLVRRETWDRSGNLWMPLPWWPAPHFVETETREDAGPLLSSLHHSLAMRTKVTQSNITDSVHHTNSSKFSYFKLKWMPKSLNKSHHQYKTADHYTLTQSAMCLLQITEVFFHYKYSGMLKHCLL